MDRVGEWVRYSPASIEDAIALKSDLGD